jgi:hypothetical protein
VIGRLAGVAIDARVATRRAIAEGGPMASAIAARWIAANALAVRGVKVALEGAPPAQPAVFAVGGDRLAAVLAALAALPMLVDTAELPRRWRLALCALGIPTLECPQAVALAGGASVLGAVAPGRRELAVAVESHRCRVRIASADRMLLA